MKLRTPDRPLVHIQPEVGDYTLRELDAQVASVLSPMERHDPEEVIDSFAYVPAKPFQDSYHADVKHQDVRGADDQASRLRTIVQASGAGSGALPERDARSAVAIQTPAQTSAQMSAQMSAQSRAQTQTRRARVVVVASGKGGVGKTTLSVNLAVALAEMGVRVALLDADFGTANADVLCGVSPHARLEHVIVPGAGGERWHDAAPKSIREIAIRAPGGFLLIPGSTGVAKMADLSAGERAAIVQSFAELDEIAEVVIVDAGAGVGRSVTEFMACADLTLVVATPEPTSIADAYALIKCTVNVHGEGALVTGGSPRVTLVLNQVQDSSEAVRVHARMQAVCDRFLGMPCPMLGAIAQDVRVAQAVRARQPLLLQSPTTPSSVQIRGIAAKLAQYLEVTCPRTPGRVGEREGGRGMAGLVRRLLGM